MKFFFYIFNIIIINIVVFLGLYICVFISIGEILGEEIGSAFKIIGRYEPDKDLGYFHKKNFAWNYDHKRKTGFHLKELGSTNSMGFRGPELKSEKKRIILVGDSMVFGHGVDNDKTIDRQLEALLGPEYEVVNAGVAGYGPDQMTKMIFSKVKGLSPEKVFVFYYENDFKKYDDVSMSLYRLNGSQISEINLQKDPAFILNNLYHSYVKRNMPFQTGVRTLYNSTSIIFNIIESLLYGNDIKEKVKIQIDWLTEFSKANNFKIYFYELPNLSFEKRFPYEDKRVKDLNNPSMFSLEEDFLNGDFHFSEKGNRKVAHYLYSEINQNK